METVKETLPNGNTIEYKIVNGTAYHVNTPEAVVNVLENARQNNKRVRVFYGDITTGRDWMEENETIGTIGRSTGNIKIPLLIKSSRSLGGGSLLDDCIVKITVDKRTVYQHENYHCKALHIATSELVDYPFEVLGEGEVIARFKHENQAQKYVSFITGESNAK